MNGTVLHRTDAEMLLVQLDHFESIGRQRAEDQRIAQAQARTPARGSEVGVNAALFSLPTDAYAVTSDDCYTPRWVFDAMGLHFDLDVAAPPGGPWHVPCDRYYTAADDGLAQPWDGLVWCNPPYSNYLPWAERFAVQPRGVCMGYLLPEVRWMPIPLHAADAVSVISCDFHKADGTRYRLRQPVFVAFRGVGTEPAERLAAADPYGAVLYGEPQREAS